ncbi:hypothetical protein JCM8547_000322 [Rhodosporidiobolus lusitaniae]
MPPSNSSSEPPHERLEIPTLPPPSSRFVLPPPPSDVLNRLQAFLPQIREANAMLDARPPRAEGEQGDEEEEAVVMEEISDSSDSDSSDDSSSDSDSDDDEESEAREGGGTEGSESVLPEEQRGLAGLLDISGKPAGAGGAKKILVQDEKGEEEKMEAD